MNLKLRDGKSKEIFKYNLESRMCTLGENMPKSLVEGLPAKFSPLAASMYVPFWVIPTTSISETSTGTGEGTKTAFIGLSDTLCPIMGWSKITVMLWALRCWAGPNPLSIRSCGLPRQPADMIISFFSPFFR